MSHTEYDLTPSPELDKIEYMWYFGPYVLEEDLERIEKINHKLFIDLSSYRNLVEKLTEFIYYYEENRAELASKTGIPYKPLFPETN